MAPSRLHRVAMRLLAALALVALPGVAIGAERPTITDKFPLGPPRTHTAPTPVPTPTQAPTPTTKMRDHGGSSLETKLLLVAGIDLALVAAFGGLVVYRRRKDGGPRERPAGRRLPRPPRPTVRRSRQTGEAAPFALPAPLQRSSAQPVTEVADWPTAASPPTPAEAPSPPSQAVRAREAERLGIAVRLRQRRAKILLWTAITVADLAFVYALVRLAG